MGQVSVSLKIMTLIKHHDLFCNLDASDDQLEYPTIYAAAKEGWAIADMDSKREGVDDLLECVASVIPPPDVNIDDDVTMLIT